MVSAVSHHIFPGTKQLWNVHGHTGFLTKFEPPSTFIIFHFHYWQFVNRHHCQLLYQPVGWMMLNGFFQLIFDFLKAISIHNHRRWRTLLTNPSAIMANHHQQPLLTIFDHQPSLTFVINIKHHYNLVNCPSTQNQFVYHHYETSFAIMVIISITSILIIS